MKKGISIAAALFLSCGLLLPALPAQGAEGITPDQKEIAKMLVGTAKDRAGHLSGQIRERKAALEELVAQDPSSPEAKKLRIEIRELRRQMKDIRPELKERLMREGVSGKAAERISTMRSH